MITQAVDANEFGSTQHDNSPQTIEAVFQNESDEFDIDEWMEKKAKISDNIDGKPIPYEEECMVERTDSSSNDRDICRKNSIEAEGRRWNDNKNNVSNSRRLIFDKVEVREYPMILGNGVPSSGVPVTLDWEFSDSTKCTVDLFEENRGPKKTLLMLRLPDEERMTTLHFKGVKLGDMIRASEEAHVVRVGRLLTQKIVKDDKKFEKLQLTDVTHLQSEDCKNDDEDHGEVYHLNDNEGIITGKKKWPRLGKMKNTFGRIRGGAKKETLIIKE